MIRTYRYLDEIKDPLAVTSLNLSGQNLRSIPEKVFQMVNMVRLTISRNGIKKIPAEIGQLEHLIHLDASYNKIQKLPFTFKFLQRLNVLSLENNAIEYLSNEIILPSLEVLNLAQNPLYEYTEEIKNLKVHTLLDLSGVHSKTIPAFTCCFKRLKRLVFKFAKQVPPNWIYDCQALEQLELDHSNLHSLSPDIGRLKKLKILTLTDNNLTRIPDEIGNCTSLETILLSHNILKSLPKSLSTLEKLKEVDLKDNAFERFPSFILQRPDIKWQLKDNPLLKELGVN
jgi:Leucine-rich repeat (LRR) protein